MRQTSKQKQQQKSNLALENNWLDELVLGGYIEINYGRNEKLIRHKI